MRTYYATLLLCLFGFSLTATNRPAYTWEYINTYSDIAIREMKRSGIPASITIAQGIHESSWGKGTLSVNSNNHFGIKCKKEWEGPTFYIEDDDYVNGKLTKSCFRSYSDVEASYIDHTNFLVQNIRYQTLFSLLSNDYVNWAKGLKKCGYATDPNYANKLIKTIEEYQLYEYDAVETVEETPMIASTPTGAPVFEQPQFQPPVATSSLETQHYTAAQVPDMETPQAYVLPEDYQRNSLQPTIDNLTYPTSASSTAPDPIAYEAEPTQEIDPVAFAPAKEMNVQPIEETIETTSFPETTTSYYTPVQAAPTFSAPSYSLNTEATTTADPVPSSNSSMVDRVQEDLIKSATVSKGSFVQLTRKPRGASSTMLR